MKAAAEQHGLVFVNEVFADRTYQPDGSLTPRTQPDALIEDPAQCRAQVEKIVKEGKVAVMGGGEINIAAETICLHGDGGHAVEFAKMIYTLIA
jgi:UPF0271 protein